MKLKYFMIVCAILLVSPFAWTAIKMYTYNYRVANETFDIHKAWFSYYYFVDLNERYEARREQIRDLRQKYVNKEPTDPIDPSMVRSELAVLEQLCIHSVRKYNSEAEGINDGIFIGNDLPASLSEKSCEVGLF